MNPNAKDTVYIDVDDEITTIIDKVRSSKSKIVAIVLPKRAAVFQSIVNMKLLKRTAAEDKKRIVLITSEAAILPMAGAVGLHVAKTLQSKPEIPAAPGSAAAFVSVDDTDDEPVVDNARSVGELAGMPAAPKPDEDTIEVDNEAVETASPKANAKPSKKGFNKKLMVPNFERFRLRLVLGGLAAVLLVVGWIVAFYVMPKATITIRTDNVEVGTNLAISAQTAAKELNEAQLIVPAVQKQYKKTDTQKTAATGKKDMGTKASGSVTLSLTDCSAAQVVVPAGTAVASGNFNFITQVDATLTSVKFGNQCRNSDFKEVSTATVKVVAKDAGDQFNLSARAYTVAGFANVSGTGTAMTGGTSKVVTVVSQTDVDTAKQKILDANKDAGSQELTKQLKQDGYMPLTETLTIGDPLLTATPNVDTEATEVTVNVTITYTMAGAQQEALKKLLAADINKRIDTSQQKILKDGLDSALITISDKKSNGDTKFTLRTTAVAGVQQDANEIKQSAAGKKKGVIISELSDRPGVEEVTVQYSPFWVYSTPKSANKITVEFQQNNGASSNR